MSRTTNDCVRFADSESKFNSLTHALGGGCFKAMKTLCLLRFAIWGLNVLVVMEFKARFTKITLDFASFSSIVSFDSDSIVNIVIIVNFVFVIVAACIG
jgi:hypothetical protein